MDNMIHVYNEIPVDKEVRDGYLVTEKTKKVWNTQLKLAREVDRICKKYRIKYFIIWGTLLGAVRHGGYIPWDDDFDIGFLREDYERFLKCAQFEVKDPLFLQTATSDKEFFFAYARLRDSRTTGIISYNYSPKYNSGIFIDLYPLDRITSCRALRSIQFWIRDRFEEICISYNKSNSILTKLIDYSLLCKTYQRILQLGKGERVGMVFSKNQFNTYQFPVSYVRKTKELLFENIYFPAPFFYELLLREVYGDYLRFPPRRKRGRWHEGQIIFDPDLSYKEFYEKNNRKI